MAARGPGPLLYRPAPRWQAFAAFGGALALHLTAVAIAAIRPTEKIVDLSDIPEATVEMSLETQQEPPQPTPPPEEEPPPPPPPEAIPEEKPEFVEEKPTPPPKRPPSNAPVVPLAKPKPVGPVGPMSMSSAKAVAISAPRPEYPYEARRSKVTGSGVCVMTVDTGSGAVTSAEMAQSTGSPILDNAAASAFRRWRFKPGTVSKVRTPITFTMSGAQY
ncbi:MAG TPA: energy transducer TonB [Chthoniobacterales bacterium]|nr:energy transducer TonB [Chthoniobacterales bacterium]